MKNDGFDQETEQQEDPLGHARLVTRNRPTLYWTDHRGGRSFQVESKAILGSAERADVRIDDRTVSRLHAELELKDDGLWIRDLGSKNGTYISDVLISLARAPHDAVVRLGGATLTVRYASIPTPVDLWEHPHFGPLVGSSVAMRELFQKLARIAPLSEPVLIEGETGSGKELIAQSIHAASPRAQQPFIIVDCGSLPAELSDAELFGYKRGAFTGADTDREGSVQAAHGGTIFLDEIGELPLALQPKLLRLIETKTFRAVGASDYQDADVRFIAATHRNLAEMVNEGTFREDLFFRLSVFPVRAPSLRNRREDIPMLIDRFVPEGRRGMFHPEIIRELVERPWPGNVRELRNFVGRALVLGPEVALKMLAGEREAVPSSAGLTLAEGRHAAVAEFERRYLAALLAKYNNKVADAAEEAGVDRTHLHSLKRKYRL